MSMPPNDVPAGALWIALQEMPRPTRTVAFPRNKPDGTPVGELAIWVLTQEEQMICSAAAEKFAKGKVKDGKRDDLGYATIYANASCVEILFRCCREVDNLKRSAFPSPELIRQTLTADECGRLFEHYLSVQLELGPIVADLTKEELDAWIVRLGEGGLAASPFVLLSPEMQKVLAHTMAVQIAIYRKALTSAGLLPGETPTVDVADAEAPGEETAT